MVYTSEGKFLRQIGSEGSGRGEFYACRDFALDSRGRLYVADGGNDRVQILTKEGDYIGEFPVDHEVHVIEVGPDDNLYINNDLFKSKKLVSVLSPEGKLSSSILDIVPDEENRQNVILALNHFRLGFDQDRNLLLGRSSLAVFEKYNNRLEHTFQLQLSGSEIEDARRFFYRAYQNAFEGRKIQDKSEIQDFIDDVAIACSDSSSHSPVYIAEITSHENDYYLLAAGVIRVYDQAGNLLRKYQLQDRNGAPAYIHRMCFDKQGYIYGLDSYHTFKCYKFKIQE